MSISWMPRINRGTSATSRSNINSPYTDLEICLKWFKKHHDPCDSGLMALRGSQGIYEIQSQFQSFLGNPDEQLYIAQDIESALLAQHIPFQKETHMTSIQIPPAESNEFKWLISFFLQQDKPRLWPNQKIK